VRDASGSWLVTGALPGTNAVSERWKAEPASAVAAIGAGLRVLHAALPVAACPFSWSVEDRLADIRRRAALGAAADFPSRRCGWPQSGMQACSRAAAQINQRLASGCRE